MISYSNRIGFQGEHGAYSEMALRSIKQDITPVACHSFEEIFEKIELGELDSGIIPIENSLAGSIHRNYDLLLRHSLHITGESQFRIKHCLIAYPDVSLSDIQIVRSHPQALAQCEHYLTQLGVQVESTYDTAGSVKALQASGDRHIGAIASQLAANLYDMTVLEEDIEDNLQNYTRFLLLGRQPVQSDGECKTSIVFALKNQPGALFKALACFALRDIDLTKIESRPQPGLRWKYRFYLDFIGSQYESVGNLALNHLAEMTTELRILGTYPLGVGID